MKLLLLIGLFLPCPVLAQKINAKVDCQPAMAELVYDCVIRVTRGGKPLPGAQLSVGADMPSMPMAHNLKPVKAAPGRQPGEYLARLELEMHGEWALKLRISAPLREQLVLHYRFTQSGATMSDHRRRQP